MTHVMSTVGTPTGSNSAAFADVESITQYDKFLHMALRTQPVVGQFVDVHPVAPTAPGTVIKLQKWSDLAAATTPVAADSDVDSVALPAPTQVSVTLATYANSVTTVEFLGLTSMIQIDPVKAEAIARNVIETREELIMAVLKGGTNVIYGGASGAIDVTGPTNAVVATDIISHLQVRRAVTELRARNAPSFEGENYAALIHPRVSADLRQDATAAGSWLVPHQYNANSNIWNGEVGTFEGAKFIETNRAPSALDGTASAKVYRTLFVGREALAEAVAQPYQTVVGPVTDRLMRFRPLSWKAVVGYARFREECIQRLETGCTS